MNFQTINKLISSKCIRVSFSSALGDILTDSNFIQTHRAYIINMQHIKKMNKKLFLMSRAFEVPIAKSRVNEVTDLYTKFILGEDRENV